jgi:hypothetical protein
MRSIIQWFQDRKRLAETEKLAVTIAERINHSEYVAVQGVFDQSNHGTQIAQGFFEPKTENIAEYQSPSALPEERTE